MVAVRPPEYFPRLAYIALAQHVDHFVLADTFPYRRNSFHDRSKVREAEGWHWITIPLLRHPEGAPLCEVEIETGGRWQEKHWRSFLYNYRTTMYFEFFQDTFRPFFERTWKKLGSCTGRSIEILAELYDLRTTLTRASALEGAPASVTGIVEALDVDTLVTLSAPETSSLEETTVQVVDYDPPTYRQNFEGFEPGMTAADLLFNYGREAQRMLARGLEPARTDPAS